MSMVIVSHVRRGGQVQELAGAGRVRKGVRQGGQEAGQMSTEVRGTGEVGRRALGVGEGNMDVVAAQYSTLAGRSCVRGGDVCWLSCAGRC